jgi:peptidoglycan-N-acetylglucosamine deacetylase
VGAFFSWPYLHLRQSGNETTIVPYVKLTIMGMNITKPIASLSLDLDNKWSYMKTHGDSGWEAYPSYLEIVVPRVLRFLKDRNLTITFFIVGRDAVLQKNQDVLKAIADAGHEMGNHSYHHEPWLHLYSPAQVDAEITRAEDAIENATGQRPVGFRAPGYSLSRATLTVLTRKNYLYDASTLPNLLAPLARKYYFKTAEFNAEQRHLRSILGGTLRDALRPIQPYRWKMQSANLIEIPVTTMPLFRTPIHVSYLFGLASFSRNVAYHYFNTALKLCSFTKTAPSLLLHPTDFLGCDDVRELCFIPGMRLPSEEKLEFVSDILRTLSEQFILLNLQQHADRLSELPAVEPTFPLPTVSQQQPV